MANERIPMTREGYEKLKADLDRMQNVEMIEVAKRIAAARDLGDLSENAEYHAAREDQGMLQAKIRMLEATRDHSFVFMTKPLLRGGVWGVVNSRTERAESQELRSGNRIFGTGRD